MLDKESYYLKKMKTQILRIFLLVSKSEDLSLKSLSTGSDLSAAEMHTLVVIGRSSAKTMSEIAQELLINVSTLSIAINKLEKKGYVRRIKNETDRRVVRIVLSAKGKRALSEHESFYYDIIREISSHMSDAEKREYIRMLSGLEELLTERLTEPAAE